MPRPDCRSRACPPRAATRWQRRSRRSKAWSSKVASSPPTRCIAIRAWPRRVCARGAHYALKLKRNHAPLFTCAEQAFATADAAGTLVFHEQTDVGHDRRERRRASVLARPADAPDFPALAVIGRIETERHANSKITHAVHYVVSSRKLSPKRLLEVTRTYWSVENQLPWQLDVGFKEDDAGRRKNYGPPNPA